MLERALSDIDEGMSVRQASMEWGIPKSTLHDYCTHQKCEIAQDDPRMYFTDFEESTLADLIVRSAKIGFGRTINDVICSYQYIRLCVHETTVGSFSR